MNWIKLNSLEKFLTIWLIIFALPGAIAIAITMHTMQLHWQVIIVAEFILLIFSTWVISAIKFRVLRAYTRASLHLDAIKQEDFNQFAKSPFEEGKVKAFHQQLNNLTDTLQQQKSQYDQHIFLVYQLMSQLAAPILVFNQKQKLTFANDAFYLLFNQPWQVFRQSTPEHLGLSFNDGEWHFDQAQSKWQIKHSEFIDAGEKHSLLIFVDIESTLRENQLTAWRQIIRVLSHEIRNSLTPVSSMAETLADKSIIERDQKVLRVITERCQHLQNFVDRYSTITTKINLNRQVIPISTIENSVSKLFSDLQLTFTNDIDSLFIDISFFEQVLINLIKNAKEAEAQTITINSYSHDQHDIIEVIDDGHGFKNLDNLFVPLYTTKQDGQGIGLSFCRNIIEQHDGVLELHNNANNGVTVIMIIPKASR